MGQNCRHLECCHPCGESCVNEERDLGKLARIYDPIGLVSPVTLQGKFLYREACKLKQAWDALLLKDLIAKWKGLESALPANMTARISLITYREPINVVELHTFGDVSGHGDTMYAKHLERWKGW